MNKVALLIIYNHRFDKNIPRLEDIYSDRFNHIFHIVPFYDGDKKNVIPIYESSYYFSGYVSQAYTHLKGKGFTHFFVVADDMIINPRINEENLWECLGLKENECYIDGFIDLSKQKKYWTRTLDALNYSPRVRGVEIHNILPSPRIAAERLKKFGIEVNKIPIISLLDNPLFQLKSGDIIKRIYHILAGRKLKYPLVGGYSDIFLVTSDCMESFVAYCGAFAATNLFVEFAIPTALALSTDKIKFNKDIKLKQGAMWSEQDKAFLKEYNNQYSSLIKNYPKEKFYLHPIKLSQWK